MRRHSFLLLLFVASTSQYVLAQLQPYSSSYEVQKIPGNPEVSQLGRFGDIPVNKYNGTANISIPIYEIDFDGLKIPITLRYNTSGVRVEQEASWVGLGWSLSEGIAITREVNGYEDIYNFDQFSGSYGWLFSRDYLFPNQEDNWFANELSEYDLRELQDLHVEEHKPADTEPDFFSVSLPSGGCKFTLPKIENNATILTARVSDNKNFKILYDWANYRFTVTDPNGFVYEFTVLERSTGYGSYESQDNFSFSGVVRGIRFPIFHGRHMLSSWRVSRIISPRGRELNFTYDDGFYFTFPHFTEKHSMLLNGPGFPSVKTQSIPNSPAMFANITALNTKNLSLISGDFGEVDFVLGDRSDLMSKRDKIELSGIDPDGVNGAWNTYLLFGDALIAKRVDGIVVKNKLGETIRSAQFDYSYFNSQWAGVEPNFNAVDPFECDISYTRLKLDQVTVNGQKYSFDYIDPNSLPRKTSKSVDFWGFYNGINNTTKIPSFNRFYVNHPLGIPNDEFHEYFLKVTGGNRSSNIAFGKIGSLQKVTYPTGGYTVFDYEAHKVTMANVFYHPIEYLSNGSGQLRFTSLTSSPSYNYNYQYMKLAKTPTYSLYDLNECSTTSTLYNPNSVFQITADPSCADFYAYNVKINANISWTTGSGQGSPTGRAVWIRNMTTGQEYDIFSHSSNAIDYPRTLEATRKLPAGNYELRFANWSQSSPTSVVTVSATLIKYYSLPAPTLTNEEFDVGGTRIKSVTTYEYDGSFLSKKNYLYDQYATENTQQVSNGKLMDQLIFHARAFNLFDYTVVDFMNNEGDAGGVLSSDIKNQTSPSASGSHIGYSVVREEVEDATGAKLGQTVTSFSNKANVPFLKPNEHLAKIFGYLAYDDFHTTINDLPSLIYPNGGIESFYVCSYGSTYLLGVRPATFEHSNGGVTFEKVFDAAGSLVRETTNTYGTFDGAVYSGETEPSVYPLIYYAMPSLIRFQPYLKIYRSTYNLHKIQQLISSTTTEYSNGQALTTTTVNNSFTNPDHLLMTSSSATASDGAVYTTKYYYPKDILTVPFMTDLVTKNEVASPIITERYKGTTANPTATLLEKAQTFYTNTNSSPVQVLPKEVYTYNLNDVVGKQQVLFEKYSNYGILTQYRKSSSDVPVSLIWSHYGTLPIAQVVNAESVQIAFTSFDEPSSSDGGWSVTGSTTTAAAKTGAKSANTGSTITKSSLPNGNYTVGFWARGISGAGSVTVNGSTVAVGDTNWKFYTTTQTGTSVSVSPTNAYVDELRLHPVGSQMTTYTYKPLIGISTVTDPNGVVTYYQYDSFGRLQSVKDNDGNILKTASYRYVR